MQFNLHPWRYRVRICPGPLSENGEPVRAKTHGREILLCGTLAAADRYEPLLDQLRVLREHHHGPLTSKALPSFIADVTSQIMTQGGPPAIMRMQPDGTIDAGGMESLGAEPVGCECGQCGTRFASHQITTAAAEFNPTVGKLVVRRAVECEFCNHVMSWVEGAAGTGAPNGRVMSGPTYTRASVTAG